MYDDLTVVSTVKFRENEIIIKYNNYFNHKWKSLWKDYVHGKAIIITTLTEQRHSSSLAIFVYTFKIFSRNLVPIYFLTQILEQIIAKIL